MKLAVPLVSQGELIGVLNLGPRLLRAGVLLRRPQAARQPRRPGGARRCGSASSCASRRPRPLTRQRFEQELEVARLIQQNFLPKELPDLPGWQVAAYYRPAREVGGDFYDVIPLPDGRVGVRRRRRDRQGRARSARDVGHPQRAARLRAAADRAGHRARARQRAPLPGHAREDVRHLPVRACSIRRPACCASPTRGTTCLTCKTADGVVELRARGMPLGLMPGMAYEEKEAMLQPGRERAAALRRRGRGARSRARHVRLPAAEGDRRPRHRAARR